MVQPYGCTMVVAVVQVRQVEYQANGLALRGTLAVPDGVGPFPGVLIGHARRGRARHTPRGTRDRWITGGRNRLLLRRDDHA